MKSAQVLQRDVLEALGWERSVIAAGIGVAVEDGVVTLTGHVGSFPEKLAAVEAAKRVEGVRAVADRIEVRPALTPARDDTEIAREVLRALEGNNALPHERIRATVANGFVRLEGEVDTERQRQAAEAAVRALAGVRGIDDLLRIQPPPPPPLKA